MNSTLYAAKFSMGVLIAGTTAQEVDFNPNFKDLKNWTWAKYRDHVTSKLGTFKTKIQDIVFHALQYYPENIETPEFQFTTMTSDLRVTCPNTVMANIIATYFISPVYRYVVTSRPSQPIHAVGLPFAASYSMHLWDLFGFFGTIKDYYPPKASDILFQNNIRREILTFVASGKPFTATWKTTWENTALLTNATEVVGQYHGPECSFWIVTANMWSYAWIN